MATSRSIPQPDGSTVHVIEEGSESDEMIIARDVANYLKEYAREKPEVAALWCFGLGFIVGWKLKLW